MGLEKKQAPWDSEKELAADFTVRSPKRNELNNIHEIYLATWKAIYGEWKLGWSDAKILQEFHIDKHPLSSWLVVDHGGVIVGFLRHSVCLRRLDKIFVTPAYWRTGAGYALIREYFWRVAKGYDEPVLLSLEVFKETERAMRFFSYFDFQPSGISYAAGTSKKELLLLQKRFIPLK